MLIKYFFTELNNVKFLQKQFFDHALRFLVDDFKVAKTLHNTSYKITLRDDRKVSCIGIIIFD